MHARRRTAAFSGNRETPANKGRGDVGGKANPTSALLSVSILFYGTIPHRRHRSQGTLSLPPCRARGSRAKNQDLSLRACSWDLWRVTHAPHKVLNRGKNH
jgi:hypothetical protein